MNKQENKLILWLEIIWWAITAILIFAVLYPIHQAMYRWKFELWNIAFIVVFVTLVRHIFLLKFSLLARQQMLKIVLMICMIPLTFALINGLNIFMTDIEEKTWVPITGHLPLGERKDMENYLWSEMLFFSVGSIISAPAFAVRMMISIWRQHNLGTV